MESKDLTREQLDKLYAKVGDIEWRLKSVTRWLSKSLSVNDPLRIEIGRTNDQLQALRMAIHYTGASGVGQYDTAPKSGGRK
jgi:hypothetical protein